MLRPATIAFALSLAACSAPGPKISAHDAWARETGSADNAAAYVTIENKGGADELIGAKASIGEAMIHESSMDGGVMRMRPIAAGEGLSVPSNGKLTLGPGGTHIMIMGLKGPLKAGDHFDLTLIFAKARAHRIRVTVKPAGAM
ncbi:copper chaperone PCu(A)C [Sphingomonas alba]|uniref:Copper chaperone PCu(A)C n=1 Tax=Sphingomonas alba TaxID=2908208 RepID=A0ABT0RNZ6_9SPHN|nr:copper chaperone PCu(A)C [Sphingomonas alba]MCL6684361.1 copper chaperone PCu(A)C [Sphingomonas alba]